jgi:histidinol-phosphatase (PHP family)
MPPPPWRVSLHGGHSGEFCEHASGSLRAVLEAAVAAGYHTFGVSEHAPRSEPRFLYDTEIQKGFDIPRLQHDFENYAAALPPLIDEFADRLNVLFGFEAEIVPAASYRDEMLALRKRYAFDFMVGSVHYADEISLDGPPALFQKARDERGGLEPLAVRYYDLVAEMSEALGPDVVGHLDLIRRNAPIDAALDTPPIRKAADRALEAIRAAGAILDLNTAGYRKGLGSPYPAPWLVQRAGLMGIGFCFGDDSHGPADVGAGIDQARRYLLDNGIATVTVLTRDGGAVVRREISLND